MQSELNLMVKYFVNKSNKLNAENTNVIIFKNPKIEINLDHSVNLICNSYKCFNDLNSCDCQKLLFTKVLNI